MNPRDKVVAEYNKELGQLISTINKLLPNDLDVERMKKQLLLAKTADEEVLIRLSGPYLYKYQNPILESKDIFFLDPFSVDTTKLSKEDVALIESMKVDLKTAKPEVMIIINKIRILYAKFSKEEKSVVKRGVLKMLEAYIQYLIIDKQT